MPENEPSLSIPDCLRNIPILTDTAGLSEAEWLEYRRRGIGGSDVAAILGISPFRTARDIYFDKLNIVPAWDDDDNKTAFQIGHLLEGMVAGIFHDMTGYPVFQVQKMFHHPEHHHMIADIDYFAQMPDGSLALVEIKTTSFFAKDNWWAEYEEIVPPYYEAQGRHYMCVTGIDRIFFCCLLLGTNEVIIREQKRDAAYEDEMIYLERNFWENHVQAQVPPPYTEEGDLILDSAKKHFGLADRNASVITFDTETSAKVQRYLELKETKENSDTYSRQLKKDMDRLKAMIIADMGKSCTAFCESGGIRYAVTANPVRKPEVNKDNLLLLKMQYPDLYEQFVTVSEYRKLNIKAASEEAA